MPTPPADEYAVRHDQTESAWLPHSYTLPWIIIMKHRSFNAHIGFDQNTASGQIIILIRNIPLFCRFCIRPVSMCADRSLRGTPGDSRILRASAGGGCGPRGSESRSKTTEGPLMRISIRSYTSSSKAFLLGKKPIFCCGLFDFDFVEDTPSWHNQADACFCARLFVHWLRPKYSRSAKCKRACFCPRLFVSLAPP